jgi:hypothetical protein
MKDQHYRIAKIETELHMQRIRDSKRQLRQFDTYVQKALADEQRWSAVVAEANYAIHRARCK